MRTVGAKSRCAMHARWERYRTYVKKYDQPAKPPWSTARSPKWNPLLTQIRFFWRAAGPRDAPNHWRRGQRPQTTSRCSQTLSSRSKLPCQTLGVRFRGVVVPADASVPFSIKPAVCPLRAFFSKEDSSCLCAPLTARWHSLCSAASEFAEFWPEHPSRARAQVRPAAVSKGSSFIGVTFNSARRAAWSQGRSCQLDAPVRQTPVRLLHRRSQLLHFQILLSNPKSLSASTCGCERPPLRSRGMPRGSRGDKRRSIQLWACAIDSTASNVRTAASRYHPLPSHLSTGPSESHSVNPASALRHTSFWD